MIGAVAAIRAMEMEASRQDKKLGSDTEKMPRQPWIALCVCVGVCVWFVRERESGRERNFPLKFEINLLLFGSSVTCSQTYPTKFLGLR